MFKEKTIPTFGKWLNQFKVIDRCIYLIDNTECDWLTAVDKYNKEFDIKP